MNIGLFEAAEQALASTDPDEKIALTRRLNRHWQNTQPDTADHAYPLEAIGDPGRPVHLKLVHPSQLRKRSLHSEQGRLALIHAIAHIEFNAINLALDAVYRFRHLPDQYYHDWLRVASEEAYHFSLLRQRLRDLQHDYADLPAHDGLWDMAKRTAHDPLIRMALVPRVLEARGLDVTPAMIEKLRQAGDDTTADILVIILRDEITHVEIGSRWFHYFCEQRSLNPDTTFRDLLKDYFKGELRGPFNIEARQQAGFSQAELAELGQHH